MSKFKVRSQKFQVSSSILSHFLRRQNFDIISLIWSYVLKKCFSVAERSFHTLDSQWYQHFIETDCASVTYLSFSKGITKRKSIYLRTADNKENRML